MTAPSCWTPPYKGAVSLTFDDGTVNQLEKAVPPLDEHGLKGTFYLCPRGRDWPERAARWRTAAEAGHELGNHTVAHTCSSNFFENAHGLEDASLMDVETDILLAQERLRPLAPHQEHWTFAYPCYCTHVGRGATRQSYVPVAARHFIASRTDGEYGFGNRPDVVDLACVSGQPVERMSGFEMIGLIEEITHRGQWVVLVFHEIDGARLTVGTHEFRMLLHYLRRKSDEIWTAPVAAVAEQIARFQEARQKRVDPAAGFA